MEQPKQPETGNEKKEYFFENGIPAIIERIESLFSEKEIVVVAVSGSSKDDINVGKTTVTGKIGWACRERNIPFVSMNSENSIDKAAKD